MILQAQAINPQMKLFANPWSPPAWMKTNASMLGGGDGALRDDAHGALAQYFVHFLQEYQAKGVSVWGITPQNEPSIAPSSYAGMLLPAADEAHFIASDLAPALSAAGLSNVKILGGDDIVVGAPSRRPCSPARPTSSMAPLGIAIRGWTR